MWLFCLFIVVKYSSAQVNLSPNGTATQSSTYTDNKGTWSAHFAIDDGGPTHEWTSYSCTHTGNDGKTRIWWMVSFEEQLYISNVVIYYSKSYPGRLAGYSLYVSNTTISNENIDFSTGHLCYHHTGNNVPNILQNVTCDQVGSNVIIYNERLSDVTYPSIYLKPPFLELCDVQVIGCKKGFSGGGCRFSCPKYCIDHHCNPSSRECVWGCLSQKCLNSVCVEEGKCIHGCPNGKASLFCDKKNIATSAVLVTDAESQRDSFVTDGDKRTSSCVRLMGENSLIQVDTKNQNAIKAVFVTLQDSTRNDSFRIYVTNTSMDISKPVNITVQDLNIIIDPLKIYEYTLSPVSIGRYVIVSFVSYSANSFVDVCELEIYGCLPGFYGHLCEFSCLENCNGPCDPKSGQCVFGCKDGYRGDFCDNECQPPQFGPDCSKTCHCIDKQEDCSFIDGTCPPGGCQAGWEGTSCSSSCLPGFYGHLCEFSCLENCNGPCDPKSGQCVFGCKDGYRGDFCDNECQPPQFGPDCSKTCHCIDKQEDCSFIDGTCPPGGCQAGWEGTSCSSRCKKGYFGKNCQEKCDGCILIECEPDTGVCKNTTGCNPGWKKGNGKCDIVCDDGFFDDCTKECHCLVDFCDKPSGICQSGKCERGWMLDTCSQECFHGQYGYNCAETCDKCYNSACERFEGNCTGGCIDYYGGLGCKFQVSKYTIFQNAEKYLTPLIAVAVITVLFIIGFAVLLILQVRKMTCFTKIGKQEDSPAYEATLQENSMDHDYQEVKNKYANDISEYEEIPANKRHQADV